MKIVMFGHKTVPSRDGGVEIVVEELKFGDSLATKGDYRRQLALTYVRRGLEEVSK